MASKSQASQRRRKRMRGHAEEDPEFQVAPMVDVLLVLMLFFMSITTTEILKKEKNLHLPSAKNAAVEKSNRKNEIIVNVSWDVTNKQAAFSMDGVNYQDATALATIVKNEAAKKANPIVIIRADKDTQYSNVSDLMKALGGIDISTVGFAAITGGKTGQSNK